MLLHASHPDTRPAGPIPHSLPDLVALTRRVAAEVTAGRHPVVVDPDRRWFQRIEGDDYVVPGSTSG